MLHLHELKIAYDFSYGDEVIVAFTQQQSSRKKHHPDLSADFG